jgi:DNA polymerase-1
MDKIYILDAVNYLFRSYYAIGHMTNDKGFSTNALFGFIRSLQKLKKDFSPDYMVAVFDGPDNKKSRQDIYAEYKMNRKKAPEDLYPQLNQAFNYCELAGIPAISVPEVEADDVMATIALWAEKNNMEVLLCTSDKDLYQLISDNIQVLNAHKNNLIIDAEKVKELFGVRPDQMLDLLAIMGDVSDNIPGISGFGPKTASSLLQKFDTLDSILSNIDQVPGEKKQQILKDQKSQAILSKQLATLNVNIDLGKSKDFYKLKQPNTDSLEKFFYEMKFISFLKEMSLSSTREEKKKDYQLINDENSLEKVIQKLEKEKEICLDTETTDVHPLSAKLVGIGLSSNSHEGFYIPINGDIALDVIIQKMKLLTDNPEISFFGHNFKYDYHILSRYGINIKNICFDTILASYLINPHNRRHNLAQLALENFNYTKIPFKNLISEGKKKIKITEVPLEKITEYCCEDVDITYQLKEVFTKKLKEKNLEKVLEKIELPLLPILAEMEKNGIFIDQDWFSKLSEQKTKSLQNLQKSIFEEIGKEFNLNSPKQLADILYEDLQLPSPRKKGSERSTAAKELEKLTDISPVIRKILDYRGLQKLLSTYIDALPKQIHTDSQRIHATFNQSVTATGRLSCQNPNLQNIPVRTEEGREIRKGFKPQKQLWSYLSADYSQIELRLFAHFSEDPEMIKAFEKKEDIHTHTASLVFDVPMEDVTKQMRYTAKTVNFGILYGQGAYGLSEQLKISKKEASDFIKKYFERYPSISSYLEKCKKNVEKTKVATTLFGRQRPIADINNRNQHVRAAAERLAINMPLQGTAADLIKLSMIETDKAIKEKGLEGFMILQVHDELIFEIPDTEISIFSEIVKEKMENIKLLKVPLVVDIAIGKNWGEC